MCTGSLAANGLLVDPARWNAVRAALVAGLAVAALACAAPDADDAAVAADALVIRDSAGIQLVENVEQAPDSIGWSIDTVPVLKIGTSRRGNTLSSGVWSMPCGCAMAVLSSRMDSSAWSAPTTPRVYT